MKENHGRDKESRPEKSERLFDRKQKASKRASKVYIVPRHREQFGPAERVQHEHYRKRRRRADSGGDERRDLFRIQPLPRVRV